jgi:hypothetical protein
LRPAELFEVDILGLLSRRMGNPFYVERLRSMIQEPKYQQNVRWQEKSGEKLSLG